ncbi:MAG: hypothetical protein OEM91_03665, partial [Hyphomicrobiales bacterium]|nr:hypothetical protein [Hyphomicrobiales bacterium]
REPRGARLDRTVDALEHGSRRWQRFKSAFPGLIKVFLIFGLAALSWLATYTGMLELIIANTGSIDFGYKVAVGFAVAMLMGMIIYILDALFSPIGWGLRTLYVFGYLFLTLISVGFGFGFYWKFLESRAEATRSAESAVAHVQGSLQKSQVQLDQLQATLTTLTALSRQKAIDERTMGNTCPGSKPGDGPRRRLRDADASSFAFVSDFIGGRSKAVKKDFDALAVDLTKVIGNDPTTFDPATGTRNSFMRGLNRKLDLTITRFNALRNDPQLGEHRDRLAERSQKTTFTGGGITFSCPDPQLQSSLRGVVKAIDALPELEKPDIMAVEGSEAIVEAFRRLTVTMIGALQFKRPPGPEELRELQQKAVQSLRTPAQARNLDVLAIEPGLGTRDYIPLFIALFVDFCILLVSINRPINRFQMLVTLAREAREGPISGILEKFHATHMDGLSQEFEIFQHVVFDFVGDYYVAVPLSAKRADARYLANLFVSLEGKGIVDRVLLPPAFIVRRKLEKQNSDFAQERAFRMYRFRDGAWSKLVLDAILGTERTEPKPAPVKGNGAGMNGNGAADPDGAGSDRVDPAPPPGSVTVYNHPGDEPPTLPRPRHRGDGSTSG